MLRKWAIIYIRERFDRGEMRRRTANKLSYTLADFCVSFGARPVNHLGPKAVERWLAGHPEWKPSTRATRFGQVKLFCRWMVTRKVIAQDPFRELRTPKRPRRAPRPLSRPQYHNLLAVLPDARARLVVSLMFWLGLRCCEVSRLTIEDIDWHAKVLHVRGKGDAERRMPIVPQVELAMNGYLRECPAAGGPLIRSQTRPFQGVGEKYIGNLVARWCRDAGIKHAPWDGVGAHAMRHSFGTELAEACGDVFIVQEGMGHASPATAAYYVQRASTTRLRDALALREVVSTSA